MTHSPLFLIRPKLKLPAAITQPTSEGVNSITVYQPIVMMFAFCCQCEVTRTIGPGSKYRRIFETGKSAFVGRIIAVRQKVCGWRDVTHGMPSIELEFALLIV